MHISELEIRNYKSIEKLKINLSKNINIFVGKNGVGKTAIFEAIKHLVFGNDEQAPEYISLEIADTSEELGKELYTLLKSARIPIPPRYLGFFERLFLPNIYKSVEKEILKIVILGERRNNRYIFYLKCNGVFFSESGLTITETALFSSTPMADIRSISGDEVAGATNLLEFIANATRSGRLITLGLDKNFVSSAFEILQRNCFFVKEMRDLQKENEEGINEKQKGWKSDTGYRNRLGATLDPSTFIDILWSRYNSKQNDGTLNNFKELCANDGYKVDVIKEHPHSTNVILRIVDKQNVSLDNRDFPAGWTQKIFFNFVMAVTKGAILFFEEPENNLHPGLQKTLFNLLKERNSQTIIITHSPEFVDYETFNNVYKFDLDNGHKTKVSFIEKTTDKTPKVFNGFFIIDKRVFFSDYVVLCEGDCEHSLLPKIVDDLLGQHGYFESKNILLVNMTTDSATSIYRPVLEQFRIPHIFILDTGGNGAQRLPGYDKSTKTYVYCAKDFDECYNNEAKFRLKHSNNNEKKKFVLEVIREHLETGNKITSYLTEDAKRDFQKLTERIKTQYETRNIDT